MIYLSHIRATIKRIGLILLLAITPCLSHGDEPRYNIPPGIELMTTTQYYDPIEPVNRYIYRFNARFDRYIFLPTVAGYRYITPDPVENSISNFFNNLREIPTFINSALQLKGKTSLRTAGRFIVNSTVGIAGLFDTASHFGIQHYKEDFGQTLGYWGVPDGPFVVLPILGPSNLRDATGFVTDSAVVNNIDLFKLDDVNHDGERITLLVMDGIDTRKNTAFRYFETGTPFEYELIRRFYGDYRRLLIEK